MKQINNILVASELNKESYEALAYGITLGLIYDAKVSCMHVVNDSPIDIIRESLNRGSLKYGEAIQEAMDESQTLLTHIVDVIAKELGVGEVEVDLNIVSGTLSKCIMTHADKIDADIVIIGTEPGSRFSRTPHTNLALNLIELEVANVLLIPSGYTLERIEQFGAFIDLEVEDVDFVHKMIRHAKSTDNPIKFIHVIESNENMEKAKAHQKSFEKIFDLEIKNGKVEFLLEVGPLPHIVNTLKPKYGVDLMVVRAYRRHWDIYSLSTAFADNVIKNIKCPLMIWKTSRKLKRIQLKEKLKHL